MGFVGHAVNGSELKIHPENVIQTVYHEKGLPFQTVQIKTQYISTYSRVYLFYANQKKYVIHFERDLIFNRYKPALTFEVKPENHLMELSNPVQIYKAEIKEDKIVVNEIRPIFVQPFVLMLVFTVLIVSAVVEIKQKKAEKKRFPVDR